VAAGEESGTCGVLGGGVFEGLTLRALPSGFFTGPFENENMNAFRVFISSIMNPEVEDLRQERIAAKTAIDGFAPIATSWAFEAEPASTKQLLDFYLGAVKECDLLLLILGAEATKPVSPDISQ